MVVLSFTTARRCVYLTLALYLLTFPYITRTRAPSVITSTSDVDVDDDVMSTPTMSYTIRRAALLERVKKKMEEGEGATGEDMRVAEEGGLMQGDDKT